MTVARDMMQGLIDAGGTLPRSTFNEGCGYANVTLSKLRDLGLIENDVRITDAGRAYMDQPPPPRKIGKRRKIELAMDRLDGALRHPLATADEKIEEIKRQAHECRALK